MANYSDFKNFCVLTHIVEKQAMEKVRMNWVVGITEQWLVKQVGCEDETCYFSFSFLLNQGSSKTPLLCSVSSENELEHGKLFRRVKVILTQWENE